MSIVLLDGRPMGWAIKLEVREQDIANGTPATATWDSSRLVSAITCCLQGKATNPCLDVSPVSYVAVVWDDGDVADLDILHTTILEILSEASDCHSVAAMASGISDVDIVRPGFDGDAIVAALINEIFQPDVVHVHSVCKHQQVPMSDQEAQDPPKPSVFCTQFTPYGAFTAVALQ